MQALAGASGLEGVNVVRCATVLFIFARFSQIFGEKCPLCPLYPPPPPLQNICSNTCLKRGSEISVRLWNFAGFLTRNCSFIAYFCATESKRKLFERAGLPACARRYGWHDGRSIAQMVESGKFGWALGASQNGGEFLATSGELHWDSAHYSGQPQIWDAPVGVGVRPTTGVFSATSGQPPGLRARRPRSRFPKSGLHPSRAFRGVAFRRNGTERSLLAGRAYWATNPPSTAMIWPTTYEARSEQSQTTASAISSGLAGRPIGCQLSASSRISGLLA